MWPESEKTEELLGAVREGNAEAVNKLIDRHRDAILGGGRHRRFE